MHDLILSLTAVRHPDRPICSSISDGGGKRLDGGARKCRITTSVAAEDGRWGLIVRACVHVCCLLLLRGSDIVRCASSGKGPDRADDGCN